MYLRRREFVTAALAGCALLVTGCGSSSKGLDAAASSTAAGGGGMLTGVRFDVRRDPG